MAVGDDYFVYTVCVALFTRFVVQLLLIDYPATAIDSWGYEQPPPNAMSLRNRPYFGVMILFLLIVLGFTCYIFTVLRYFTPNAEGDYVGRFNYLLGFLIIVFICAILNSTYKFASVTGRQRSNLLGGRIAYGYSMMTINYMAFASFIMVRLAYLYEQPIDVVHNENEGHSDIPSQLLLASGIFILATSTLNFIKFHITANTLGNATVDDLDKLSTSSVSTASAVYPHIISHVKKYGIPININSQGIPIHKINEDLLQRKKGLFSTIPITASKNVLLEQSDFEHALHAEACKKIQEDPQTARKVGIFDKHSFVLRSLADPNTGGDVHYIMSKGHAQFSDNVLPAAELLHEDGHHIQTSSGVLARIGKQNYDTTIDDAYIDPSNRYMEMVPKLRVNYDYVASAHCIPFTTKVYGYAEGVGLWLAFNANSIIPFVLFEWGSNQYFLTNTLTGTIVWALTTWLPLFAAMRGHFGSFWELFTLTFLVSWVVMIGMRGFFDADSLYVFDQNRWNNTYIWSDEPTEGMVYNSSILTEPGDELNQSTTYYYVCGIGLAFSIFGFLSQLSQTIGLYCLNSKVNGRFESMKTSVTGMPQTTAVLT